MPTTLPSGVDPGGWLHPLAQSWHNIRYAPHCACRVDYCANSNRQSDGNALIILVPGGSWKANDQTSFLENSNGNWLWGNDWTGYLLNSAVQGTTRMYFDVASADFMKRAWEGIAILGTRSADYQKWYTGTGASRIGIKSYPGYHTDSIRSIQKVVQYFKKYATRYGINPNRIFLAGHSVGACTSLGAAFSYGPGYIAGNADRFGAEHDSSVRGVINMAGEVNLDPWYMAWRHVQYNLGQQQVSTTARRNDIDRLLLQPDSSGAFPQGQPKTPLAKSISPVDIIAAAPSDLASTRVRSYYWKNHSTTGPSFIPPGPYEETQVPFTGYGAIPPYDAAGHDWRQFATIEAACLAKEPVAPTDGRPAMHTGRVLDAFDFYPTVQTNSIVAAIEGMLAESYDWMCDIIEAD